MGFEKMPPEETGKNKEAEEIERIKEIEKTRARVDGLELEKIEKLAHKENEKREKYKDKMKISSDVSELADDFSEIELEKIEAEKKTMEAEKEKGRDGLTSLRLFDFLRNEIPELIKRRRKEDKEFGLMFLDLDNFKSINDTYGHLVGDNVLKDFAKILESSVRPSDIVCRRSGDEFVIFFSQADAETPERVEGRIKKALESYDFEGMKGKKVGVSAGYVISSEISSDPSEISLTEMEKIADERMYVQKKVNHEK